MQSIAAWGARTIKAELSRYCTTPNPGSSPPITQLGCRIPMFNVIKELVNQFRDSIKNFLYGLLVYFEAVRRADKMSETEILQ